MQNIIITIPMDEIKDIIVETIRNEFQRIQSTERKPGIDFITRQETAKLLGVSLNTLNEWTKKGLIPGYRISSRVRYKKSEIVNSLAQINTLKYRRGI